MWKDILKNQMNVAGLSMRSMDLDNIIEEEEEPCKKRLQAFFDKIRSQDRFGNVAAEITDDMKINFVETLGEEIACNIIDELMRLDKSIKERGLTNNHLYYTFMFRGLMTVVTYEIYDTNRLTHDGKRIRAKLHIKYDYYHGGLELDIYALDDGDVFKFIKENL